MVFLILSAIIACASFDAEQIANEIDANEIDITIPEESEPMVVAILVRYGWTEKEAKEAIKERQAIERCTTDSECSEAYGIDY